MLLPSALPCDVRRSSRFTPSRLFSTPPPSGRNNTAGNGLLGTCRALQSLLGSPAPTPRRSPKPQRLQSPLPINPPRRSPRTRKVARPASPRPTPPPQTVATTPSPPAAPARGANKRRRSSVDDDESDADIRRGRFSTPKRQRHIPYELPLGLAPTDFYSLHSPPITQSPPSAGRRQLAPRVPDSGVHIDPDAALPSIEESDEPNSSSSEEFTAEEDQHLIELVLEKFRLSQQEWDECARRMGRANQPNVSQRWHTLVGQGRVGLRARR
ncbi:hypothetical protein N7492_000491 [Penicillium capsulatum]|uniref:Myb-like domain-containing protein n=1 Tax=Penicillium capsulatum TaxID=69766 RepID=A0A9W9LZ08_9EURO|nr:hypothetical protein N7492_000491 [Penicillium capsulatum]KAJ6130451.1 hypothetical protein N7512_003231 [Penicillium capsulatum]